MPRADPRLRRLAGLAAHALALALTLPAPFANAGPEPKREDLEEDLELLRQEEPEEVVVGAAKLLQRRGDAPAAVTVLTSDDLRRFGYRTVAEAIRGLTGVHVMSGRDADYVGVRGLGLPGDFNTRILVTLNGHPLNEVWNNSSAVGDDLGLDIALVERIEIVRGPASSTYGTGAFMASVHVTTKTGADLEHGHASVEVGSFGLARVSGTFAHEWTRGYSLLANAYYLYRTGEPLRFPELAATRTAGYAPEGADRSNGYGFLGVLRAGDFTLHGKYHTREQGLAFAPFGTVFADETNALQEKRGFVELRYDKRWRTSGALREGTVSARAHFDAYDYDDTLAYSGGERPLSAGYTFRDSGRARWYGAELRGTFDFGRWSKLVVGAEYQEAFDVESRAWIPAELYAPGTPTLSMRDARVSTPFTGAAAYLYDELRVAEAVSVVGGVRLDAHSRFERAVTPRAGLLLRPSDEVDAKLLYGVGFRNPSVYEAFFQDGVDIAANPSLRPERIETFEAVYEHRLREDLRLRVGAFYSWIENLIQLDTVDVDPRADVTALRRQFRNAPRATSLVGGEVRLHYRPSEGWLAYFSASLQRARQDGAELANAPGVLVSGGFSAPLWKDRLFGGLEAHVVGARVSDDGRTSIDPYAVVNLHLYATKIGKRVSLSAKVENLLDARYGEVPRIERTVVLTIPGPRRTFLLKADLDW